MPEKPKKIPTYKTLEKNFWELSRKKQEAFLATLYKLSQTNKDCYALWLGGNEELILEKLKKDIEKETIERIPRYRKLRISKINEILRSAERIPISAMGMIELYRTAWEGTTAFVIAKKWLPDRYRVSSVKYLEKYLDRLNEIQERSEKYERLEKTKKLIETILSKDLGYYFPQLEIFYQEKF